MISKESVCGFLAGGALVSGVLALKHFIQKSSKNPQKIPTSKQNHESDHYDQLKNEQLARIIKYFGEEKFNKMENSYVIVFGVGGVGSHVVNMLARSGVKRIKIVDFDRVSLSSLNRHSFALREDVGRSKVQCIKGYVSKILPHIKIQIVQTYVTVENAASLLQESPDYVIDCIDNLDAKVEIINICKEKNIRLIVSGGAGMKCDPTKLQIRDISDCKYDALIMRLKRELTKKGIKHGVTVAFSYQQAEKELLPLNQVQEKEPQSFKVFDNYRIRIVPVLGTMPAILGMAIASYVLCQLAGEPYKPFQTDYVKSTTINKLYNQFLNDERRRGIANKDVEIDMEEISILAKQVFKWKCIVTDKKQNNPRIIRWDPQRPSTIDNLALMNRQQYEKHQSYKNISELPYSSEIMQRFKEKSTYAKYLYDKGFMMFI